MGFCEVNPQVNRVARGALVVHRTLHIFADLSTSKSSIAEHARNSVKVSLFYSL